MNGFRRWLVAAVLLHGVLSPLRTFAYAVGPVEGLDKMATNAPFIFKGKVLSFAVITNTAFPPVSGFEARRTEMQLITVLKGESSQKRIHFEHYAISTHPGPMMYSPQYYDLETSHSYLVFAAQTETPWTFRQLRMSHTGKEDEGVLRTLDSRPIKGLSVKDAHWFELNLFLTDAHPTNCIYGIEQLDLMSKRCQGEVMEWNHSADFVREAVLGGLQPLVQHTNDAVAIAALKVFQTGSKCAAQLEPYATELASIASSTSFSTARRVQALASLAGTAFPIVSNSLPRWLGDRAEEVRAQAVLLLPDFSGSSVEDALRTAAGDTSPSVRGSVANAIARKKLVGLLPTLERLLSDQTDSVHASAATALLQFETGDVAEILKQNLQDEKFRAEYVCKLAEQDAGPWLNQMAEMMEARRVQKRKEADQSGAEPKDLYFEALMALSGPYFRCWNLMYEHLQGLPAEQFQSGKLDRYLDVLENAGNTGSREPVNLYELYRTKGMNERALKFRRETEKKFANYNVKEFYDRIDARPTPAKTPTP